MAQGNATLEVPFVSTLKPIFIRKNSLSRPMTLAGKKITSLFLLTFFI